METDSPERSDTPCEPDREGRPSRWSVVPYLLIWILEALPQMFSLVHFVLFRRRVRQRMYDRILESEPVSGDV